MSYKVVNSLPAGTIATLLEVFALLMGLLIAANLQAIVTLTARRRLFTRGTARLRDSTWNVGIVEGILNPRRLLRDWRVLLAFLLAMFVILLEALTVLQTQAAEDCPHSSASDWDIRKTDQKCFKNNANAFYSDEYVAEAKKTVKDVDLEYGIPINTNVFEKSVVNGKAVKQLSKHEDRYRAPLESTFVTKAVVKVRGISRVDYFPETEKDESINQCAGGSEDPGFVPMELEVLTTDDFGNMVDIASTGFVETAGCQGILTVRVCPYGKRVVFKDVRAFRGSQQTLDVECNIYRIEREARRTQIFIVAVALWRAEKFDADTIRKAVLVSLIAENSAANEDCKRYIAKPKPCTELGWISLASVLILLGLLIATTLIRIGLSLVSRDSVNYNGSQEVMARSIFEHFAGTQKTSRDFITPGKHQTFMQRLRNICRSPPREEDEIFVSVLKSVREPDAYHLSWTREPVASAATAVHVPSNSVIPTTEREEEVEVSLV